MFGTSSRLPFLTKLLHRALGVGYNHVPYNWEYASTSARNTATGFKPSDIGKLARQTDDNTLWLLSATIPTWVAVGSGGSSSGRTLLTANRTYYVATTGNDANDGLSAGTPFLTIQKAVDVVCDTIDNGGYAVTIQVADGTYTAAVVLRRCVGRGTVTLQGNNTTPANCVISTTSATAISGGTGSGVWNVQGFKLQTTTSGFGLTAGFDSCVIIGNLVDFGACATGHMFVGGGGAALIINSSYTISGGSLVHVQAENGGTFTCIGRTVTLTGTPAFSVAFVYGASCCSINIYSNTYVNSATGIRYSISRNGVCFVNGAGTTYLPGNSAGSTATGGQYV